MLGIALGLAVMLAVRLANRSATDSFRAAMESVRGRTDLCLRGVAGRFPETLLTDLGWLAQYATVSPVIESYVLAEDRAAENRPGDMVSTAGQGDVLHLLGVDILVDQPIRQYHLLRTSGENREPTTQELLRLLADPHAIVLTQRYAHRHGKQLGDRISLVFGSQRQEVVIRGLLLDEGPARALDGNFALMDLAAAQWACKRLGYLDRVDLALHAGLDRDQAAAEIARRLPAGLIVEPPQADADRAETMIAAFHFNLLALSGVALLVGLFSDLQHGGHFGGGKARGNRHFAGRGNRPPQRAGAISGRSPGPGRPGNCDRPAAGAIPGPRHGPGHGPNRRNILHCPGGGRFGPGICLSPPRKFLRQ